MSVEDVLAKIRRAEREADRSEGAVRLVAVSKVQPIERVQAALDAGQRIFGENRVQEAQKRWPSLRDQHPDIKLHLIGPLQSNKVKQAVELFDVIESVDREKVARAIARESQEIKKNTAIYIQVNTGEEPQKSGVIPSELDHLVDICVNELGLNLVGLMTIPPVGEPPAPHFALLKKLADKHGLQKLSMGMSADYETAIMMGATSVRVGSAVFGERTSQA